jgi:hypothetical protein
VVLQLDPLASDFGQSFFRRTDLKRCLQAKMSIEGPSWIDAKDAEVFVDWTVVFDESGCWSAATESDNCQQRPGDKPRNQDSPPHEPVDHEIVVDETC